MTPIQKLHKNLAHHIIFASFKEDLKLHSHFSVERTEWCFTKPLYCPLIIQIQISIVADTNKYDYRNLCFKTEENTCTSLCCISFNLFDKKPSLTDHSLFTLERSVGIVWTQNRMFMLMLKNNPLIDNRMSWLWKVRAPWTTNNIVWRHPS